jgi:hypothetical protein
MRKPPRIALFCLALAAVAFWVLRDERTALSPALTAAAAIRDRVDAVSTLAPAILLELPVRELPRRVRDPFAAPAPAPVAIKPVAGAPLAAPAAPADAPSFPYRYVGELILPGGARIFLARGDDVFEAKQGTTPDGEYRVESMSAAEIAFTHLASGVRQTLRFGPPQEAGTAPFGTADAR